jgi:type I restriction enzyme R subunit
MNLCGNIKTMAHQSGLTLENNLIKQLVDLRYASAKVLDGDALVSNYRTTTKNR